MKAITYSKYGAPETVLRLEDVAMPTPKENEVLVKIEATAVNDYDWSMVSGQPPLYRLLFGVFKPKWKIAGMELSGVVESTGVNVTSFKKRDAVYGDISGYGFGSFAEYICINEKVLMIKPENMTFEEASALPHAGCLAAQGLIDVGKIEERSAAGQIKILINGGGGGVGTLGLQMAKTYGAEVSGVDTGNKLKMMKSLGFDHIIDYKKEDFTKNGQTYDLILDAKTNRSPFSYAKSLNRGGAYVTVGGHVARFLQLLVSKWWISFFHKKTVAIVALRPNKDLAYINELFNKGKIKPIIDGPFKLEDVPKAIQYFGEGYHEGKVIITTGQ